MASRPAEPRATGGCGARTRAGLAAGEDVGRHRPPEVLAPLQDRGGDLLRRPALPGHAVVVVEVDPAGVQPGQVPGRLARGEPVRVRVLRVAPERVHRDGERLQDVHGPAELVPRRAAVGGPVPPRPVPLRVRVAVGHDDDAARVVGVDHGRVGRPAHVLGSKVGEARLEHGRRLAAVAERAIEHAETPRAGRLCPFQGEDGVGHVRSISRLERLARHPCPRTPGAAQIDRQGDGAAHDRIGQTGRRLVPS